MSAIDEFLKTEKAIREEATCFFKYFLDVMEAWNSSEVSNNEHYSGKILDAELGLKHLRFLDNMHSAPLGKTTNFYMDSSLPKGYLGFSGTVKYSVERARFLNNPFSVKTTGINLGSGGAGEYAVKVFLEDFPRIHKAFKKVEKYNNRLLAKMAPHIVEMTENIEEAAKHAHKDKSVLSDIAKDLLSGEIA
jgi:hypothetical protein